MRAVAEVARRGPAGRIARALGGFVWCGGRSLVLAQVRLVELLPGERRQLTSQAVENALIRGLAIPFVRGWEFEA